MPTATHSPPASATPRTIPRSVHAAAWRRVIDGMGVKADLEIEAIADPTLPGGADPAKLSTAMLMSRRAIASLRFFDLWSREGRNGAPTISPNFLPHESRPVRRSLGEGGSDATLPSPGCESGVSGAFSDESQRDGTPAPAEPLPLDAEDRAATVEAWRARILRIAELTGDYIHSPDIGPPTAPPDTATLVAPSEDELSLLESDSADSACTRAEPTWSPGRLARDFNLPVEGSTDPPPRPAAYRRRPLSSLDATTLVGLITRRAAAAYRDLDRYERAAEADETERAELAAMSQAREDESARMNRAFVIRKRAEIKHGLNKAIYLPPSPWQDYFAPAQTPEEANRLGADLLDSDAWHEALPYREARYYTLLAERVNIQLPDPPPPKHHTWKEFMAEEKAAFEDPSTHHLLNYLDYLPPP